MSTLGNIFFTVGVIMIPLAFLFFVLTLIIRAGVKKRVDAGVEGVGTVTDKIVRRGKSDHYFLDVSYQWNDTPLNRTFRVKRDVFESTPESGEVILKINPNNPREAYMEGSSVLPGGALAFMILTIVFGALGLTYTVLGVIFMNAS